MSVLCAENRSNTGLLTMALANGICWGPLYLLMGDKEGALKSFTWLAP